MEQRLSMAARNGDVGALHELLKEDPNILHRNTILANPDTPLHLAAMFGHIEFAKVVMSKIPELGRKLDHQGFSPIHLASLRGNSMMVGALLEFDKKLCLLKDRNGRIPLHYAAIRGLDVIRLLLLCCPESARMFTCRNESLLHLAVRNNRCETMDSLLSLLQGLNLANELAGCIDEDGNTVLHLATARKQHQTVKLLLRETEVNVNAVNARGFTALDITEMCFSESDDKAIAEMLRNAQGQRASDNQIPPRNEDQEHGVAVDNNSHEVSSQRDRNTSRNDIPSREAENPHRERAATVRLQVDTVRNGLIVLCSIFATFSFEAALNPPGGVWQEWQSSNVTNTIQASKAKEVTNSNLIKIVNFFVAKIYQSGKIPHVNVTSPDLLGPSKAMNIALAPYDYLSFLYCDAVCFTASLATVLLVMFTSKFDRIESIIVTTMMVTILISAGSLYYRMLALVTNKNFAEWAVKVGITHLLLAFILVVTIVAWIENNANVKIRKMVIQCLCLFYVILKKACGILKKAWCYIRNRNRVLG